MRKFVVAVVVLLVSSHCFAKEKYLANKPVELTKGGRHWAEKTLKHLSLEEKVGQMIQVRYFMDFENFDSDGYKQFRDELQKTPTGVVVFRVRLEVLREVADALAEERDLNLGGAGVAVVGCELADELGLLLGLKRHFRVVP